MITPTPINEIADVPSSADLYGGGTASVIPVSQSARFTQEAALAQAEANKYVAGQHEANVNNLVASAGLAGADMKDVAPEDLPAINESYQALLKNIYANYDVVSDPASNIQKYGEIRGQLASLQGQVAKAKIQNGVYQENRKMLLAHPEWNTDENQAQMGNYFKLPAEQRSSFLLKAPLTYDPAAATKIALEATGQITDQDTLSKHGTYIVNTKGEKRDPQEYLRNWYAASAMHRDSYGHTDLQNLQKIWEQLPPDAAGNKESFDDYWKGVAMNGLTKDHQSVTIKPNAAAENKARIDAEYGLEGMREKNGKVLEQMRIDAAAGNSKQALPGNAAEMKAYTMWQAAKGTSPAPEFLQNAFGSDPANDITVKGGGTTMEKDPDHPDKMILVDRPVTTQKVPATQTVSLMPDTDPKNKGGFILNTVINSQDAKGALVTKPGEPKHLSFDEAMQAMNGMQGHKFGMQMAAGTSQFNKAKLKTTNPQLDDLEKYFNPGGGGAAGQGAGAKGGMTDDAFQSLLKRNGLIK